MTDILDVPAADTDYYSELKKLRSGLSALLKLQGAYPSFAEKKNGTPSLEVLKTAVDRIAPPDTIARLAGMHSAQAPQLEEILLKTTLELGVPLWMGIEDPQKALIQYLLRVEGISRRVSEQTLIDPKTDLSIRTIKIGEPVTLEELQRYWRELLVVDRRIDEDAELRKAYTPKCRKGKREIDTLLVTTVHEFRLLDGDGKLVLPPRRYDARTKSGLETAFKHTDWLLGVKGAVEDYLASRSVSSAQEFPERFVRFIEGYPNTDWRGLLTAQNCYTYATDGIEEALEGNGLNGLASVHRGKIRPSISKERDTSAPRAVRFIEGRLPHWSGNQINHHFETDKWYNEREGIGHFSHLGYAARRLEARLGEWSPLHWLVFLKVAVPIFSSGYTGDFATVIAENRLHAIEKALTRYSLPTARPH